MPDFFVSRIPPLGGMRLIKWREGGVSTLKDLSEKAIPSQCH